MSLDRVLFAFVIVLALTMNVGFTVGDFTDVRQHNSYELFGAIVVSIIATIMKFGDRTPLGSTMLATSLVADLQLVAAAVAWGWFTGEADGMTSSHMSTVVSLAAGALVANVVSVVLLVIEVSTYRR